MKFKNNVYQITTAALLCAIGILIPIVSPLKILIEPASFTLASHVAIFISMFISPVTAVFVSIGTTLGFLISGAFPPVVVARAASQVIFATIGAIVLSKKPNIINSFTSSTIFAFLISVIHALGEIIAVIPFYFLHKMSAGYYERGFVVAVLLLVGVGTIVHSMVDFYISYFIWKPIRKAVMRNQ